MPQEAAPPPVEPSPDVAGTGLSRWITYDRNNCCIGQGGGIPILTEVQFRIGPSFPMGGEYFGQNLDIGWTVELAGRAMCFDRTWTRAWAFELGISNTYNSSHTGTQVFLDHNINQFVSVRALDRTFANFAIGREWYLWAPANDHDGLHWRAGADFGGRWGAATVKFNEIRHRTQVCEGIVAAIHTDLEIPCGRCTYLAGVRGEYNFTWSNVFDQGAGNLQDMVFLFNFGVRY